MMSRFSLQSNPRQEAPFTSLPIRQPKRASSPAPSHVAVPVVAVTPATPHLTLTGPHGGNFSTITLVDEADEKDVKEPDSPTPSSPYIPPSRRFLHPDQHPRVPALLAAEEDPRASSKKRRSIFFRIFLVLALLGLAIGLGVGLSARNNNTAPAGEEGGVPRASNVAGGTTASEGGTGASTMRGHRSVISSALLTMASTSTAAGATATTGPRWGGVGGGNVGGVALIKTGHEAAHLEQPKKRRLRRLRH
ncbi:hypothetical protein JCM10213_003111 [Rhodosporidiobolus nylandii]